MNRPIGIDLGTTYSAAAVVDEDGKPRILPLEDSKPSLPSVVQYSIDEVIVGQMAQDQAVAFPHEVVRCVKRFIGDMAWRFEAHGKIYTPEEVSAEILKAVKIFAEQAIGPVTQAVITVPAYFLDVNRQATIKAAEYAGLEVLKLVNEPTAAAISYGLDADLKDKNILVYDLGGGTFDVTVMRVKGNSDFDIQSIQGNHQLGGVDWDKRICDLVAKRFIEQHDMDPRDDLMTSYDLLVRAEKAKIALTQMQTARLVCQYSGKITTLELTRLEFEKETADLLDLTNKEVDLAVSSAGMRKDDIDLVLLVGGSSKMPMVQTLMCNKGKEMKISPRPDHCVALGAAIEAARKVTVDLGGGDLFKAPVAKKLEGICVMDCTPHSLGLLTVERDRLVNTVIIPKGSEIVCEKSRDDLTTHYDNQDTVTVHLVQGESEDPIACIPVASYDFKGIPLRSAGESRIRVIYSHNENCIVNVKAIDILSGESLEQEKRPLLDIEALINDGTNRDVSKEPGYGFRSVVLLIDTSSSMIGRELQEAKDACFKFIDETDFHFVRTGLVRFGSSASCVHPLSRSKTELKQAVEHLEASGSTAMAEAIRCGMDMLNEDSVSVPRFIVLFTDGEPNSPEQTHQAAKEAKESGIQIITVGVEGARMAFLEEIATSTRDKFFASDGQQLVTTFGNIARLISGRKI
jgi:molecular chaperone DnaK